jgi:hypothetical protein
MSVSPNKSKIQKKMFLTEIKNDILYFKIPLSRVGKYSYKKYPILKNMDKVFNPESKTVSNSGLPTLTQSIPNVYNLLGR